MVAGPSGDAVARHLSQDHGVRKLVVLGARATGEPADPGVETLVLDCDLADRTALASALAGLPEDWPVVGVVYDADDTDSPNRVMATASNLAELVPDAHRFVLLSATAGVPGVAGQRDQAMTGAFLDALAAQRRAAGRIGTYVARGSLPLSQRLAVADAAGAAGLVAAALDLRPSRSRSVPPVLRALVR
ncbi:hypothetical protein CFP71_02985, partial [Amycolatopsis thailandensis]